MRSLVKRLFATAAAAAVIPAAMVVSASTASADTPYRSISTPAGAMCLDIPRGTTDNHVAVQIYYCNGGTNQQWIYRPSSVPGYGQLVNVASGSCADVPRNDLNDFAPVEQYVCGPSSANQMWSFDPASGQLRALHSGKCLTISSYAYKSKTFQYTCGIAYSQRWQLNV
ncbi:RICIN domain-containing protein [Actinokineospora sp. NBRC 105648]|uniref:RICIN domain-containing protein n=1 Tax=Actinokineospora sp. NBRC 105648 TaxID=3032206 RepID=UPI0024A35FE4|nr:RICIN domain-containing protein [Actinokineospora sp. NBRC 105648]GLZ36723.1 hypothetical protein Acsp05_03480 [Actinokineospora sp. NBRC 105648]